MPRRTDRRHDRSAHRAELTHAAGELARQHGRTAQPIVDVAQWLDQHRGRAVDDVLYVVWDRTDAAMLEHEHPELTVRAAAPRMRYRHAGTSPPADLPPYTPPRG